MTRSKRRIAAALLAVLLVSPLTGCRTRSLTIEIPGFDSGAVTGLWLWRFSGQSQAWERICDIQLGEISIEGSSEHLGYQQMCPGLLPGYPLRADIERAPGNPDTIIVEVFYMRWEDPGLYRATSYNEAGESALSPGFLEL